MFLPTLYARSVTEAVLIWKIEVVDDAYRTTSGQLDSPNLTTTLWSYGKPKNVGKKNETTAADQALKEAKALYKKKLDEGYWEDISDINKERFFEPMLAQKYYDRKKKIRKKLVFPVAVEDKLNGIRSCHFKRGSFSRKGKEFHNIDHIREVLAPLFEKHPNLFIDGELFNYKLKNLLNRISELVSVNRKPKDITPELREESRKIVRLVCYDGYGFDSVTKETPFVERRAALTKLLASIDFIDVLQYKLAYTHDEIDAFLKAAESRKEEGVIIRVLNAPYENKRSKYLLKYKNFEDEEFKVIDILEGEGNWQGCAKQIVCELNEPATTGETTFISNIDGKQEQMRELLLNKQNYIGQLATVRFQEYSEFGIPLIPFTSLPFRTYE